MSDTPIEDMKLALENYVSNIAYLYWCKKYGFDGSMKDFTRWYYQDGGMYEQLDKLLDSMDL